jgi:hypothetical protein
MGTRSRDGAAVQKCPDGRPAVTADSLDRNGGDDYGNGMSQSDQPPLLREFIAIPERTSTSDFVLQLTEGVSDASETLREYVITDRLVGNFDEALGLISSALAAGSSKAAYLHGSFGSGKSHFMAVLHALLRGEPAARSRDEFAGLLAKHDGWLNGRKFLLVPYHLLGAKSLEQRVLGGYLAYVRRLHPQAPIPAIHRTDALLDQSRGVRARIGDEAFIAGLPGDEDDEWGDGQFWTSERLDTAFAGTYDDPLRKRLVSDLLTSDWGRGFFSNALEDAEGFISLDRGLSEISRHAKELGYDGLILFLDELILWLANSIGDQQFVSREIQKITNFVESGDARRPIPVVSFIARQRDLRELVGQDVPGASEMGFQDTLNLASGRFDLITLEDRNLPEIARKRLLRPVDESAAAAINRAFETTTKVRREVWDTLLGTDSGSGADIDSFRKTYPFSPAFISTLVHVSSALQRSRTALKLMRQLLVDRRDELRLGQLVPLGDLYAVISRGGDQPFTEKLKAEFETAQKLYEGKLRPYLLDRYDVTDEDVERARHRGDLPADVAGRVRAFAGDDRLIKTLLLAALAPSVPALHNLTARKLSALNHGSITSPIPGGEVSQVSRKITDWAGQFGEIKVIDGDDPGVRLELVGVDVDSVLNSARHYDNVGARKAMVKRLLWSELEIAATDRYVDEADLVWRGSKRSIEVIYGNVRDDNDIRDDVFHPIDPAAWRLIVDYPFDDGTHGPADDRNRVQKLSGRFHSQVVCWIPAALTIERMGDLGRLVMLDAVLSGQRFDSHAEHLSKDDRRRAHATLTSQRDALMVKMRGVLRQAYGLAGKQPSDVLTSYDQHLLSLSPGLHPVLPMGARMADALRSIADQMLKHQYPAHPDFDPDRKGEAVRPAEARTVLEYIRKAVESPDGRVEVDRKDRLTMRRIANPLLLGEMHEAAFVIGRHWVEHFHRKAAQEGIDGDLRAKDLLGWLDQPDKRGLDRLIAQLVLATFAEQTDRTWVRHGGVLAPQPELTAINDDLALRTPERPDDDDYAKARERAMDLFGFMPSPLPRGRLVAMFVQDLSNRARQYRDAARSLVDELERRADQLGIDATASEGRLHTARAAADLLDGLGSRHNSIDIIKHLANADLGGPAQRAGKSIRSADEVARALRSASWDNFGLIAGLGEPWSSETDAIFAKLRDASVADELTTPLAPALNRARVEATDLLRRATRRDPTPTGGGPTPGTTRTTKQGTATVGAAAIDSALRELAAFAAENPETSIEISWRVVP